MGQIKITANAITKEEQLDIARLLMKEGYTVNIKKRQGCGRQGKLLYKF